jgi:TetR/AcrR family transcriptional regulator, tetracycline repressor protein
MALAKDLSRDKVVDAALSILRDHGLAALSMRQVAAALGVQPSALYWHVESKQELLAQLAERILADPAERIRADPAATRPDLPVRERLRLQALDIRTALLAVRDGAEVVSFAQALRPREHSPMRLLHETLRAALPEPDAEWGAQTLAHYILGEVAEEQNHAELARAGILPADEPSQYSAERFWFGAQAIFDGLTHRPEGR